MAMLKYATAAIVHQSVSKTEWANIRVAGKGIRLAAPGINDNLIERASEMMQTPFDPSKFLLTHATIVSSVDTYAPPGTKTGSVLVEGFRVNLKYPEFRVTQNTAKYINSNNDFWPRAVLLKAYPTFIGGHSFLEHVQLEELSKGRIIDAVARDIGESIYVDILIANDRKHADLIHAIESGEMSTLSMGCLIDGSQCSKCGHWAADETELCSHIKYMKGNTFFDEQGNPHKIAEKCGDESLDPTGGVTFIEASWVKSPAFLGAVARNILTPTDDQVKQATAILSSPPPQWSADANIKAASRILNGGGILIPKKFGAAEDLTVEDEVFLAGWEDGEDAGGESAEPSVEAPKEEASPVDDMVKRLEEYAAKEVERRLREKMQKPAEPDSGNSSLNETIMKQAGMAYQASMDVLVRTASSDASLIDAVAELNNKLGIHIPVGVYRAALRVGSVSAYSNADEFRVACDNALGRRTNLSEARTLIRLGKLLSRRLAMGQQCSVDGSRQGGSK